MSDKDHCSSDQLVCAQSNEADCAEGCAKVSALNITGEGLSADELRKMNTEQLTMIYNTQLASCEQQVADMNQLREDCRETITAAEADCRLFKYKDKAALMGIFNAVLMKQQYRSLRAPSRDRLRVCLMDPCVACAVHMLEADLLARNDNRHCLQPTLPSDDSRASEWSSQAEADESAETDESKGTVEDNKDDCHAYNKKLLCRYLRLMKENDELTMAVQSGSSETQLNSTAIGRLVVKRQIAHETEFAHLLIEEDTVANALVCGILETRKLKRVGELTADESFATEFEQCRRSANIRALINPIGADYGSQTGARVNDCFLTNANDDDDRRQTNNDSAKTGGRTDRVVSPTSATSNGNTELDRTKSVQSPTRKRAFVNFHEDSSRCGLRPLKHSTPMSTPEHSESFSHPSKPKPPISLLKLANFLPNRLTPLQSRSTPLAKWFGRSGVYQPTLVKSEVGNRSGAMTPRSDGLNVNRIGGVMAHAYPDSQRGDRDDYHWTSRLKQSSDGVAPSISNNAYQRHFMTAVAGKCCNDGESPSTRMMKELLPQQHDNSMFRQGNWMQTRERTFSQFGTDGSSALLLRPIPSVQRRNKFFDYKKLLVPRWNIPFGRGQHKKAKPRRRNRRLADVRQNGLRVLS